MVETLKPLFIVTPVLLMLAIGIILFVFLYQRRMLQHQEHLRHLQETRQRQLLEAALEAQESERRRVARDLHDEVGGMLALVRLNIGQLAGQSAETTDTALQAKHLLDEAIVSVRRISHDLMPVVLEKLGLLEAIKSLTRSVPADSGLEIKFTTNLDQERLEPRQELLLFRILQELLNNSLKHAEASLITVDLHKTDAAVTLTYTDNGKGFTSTSSSQRNRGTSGLGLKNLQSRVSLLGGALSYNSAVGAGLKAEIVIPIS